MDVVITFLFIFVFFFLLLFFFSFFGSLDLCNNTMEYPIFFGYNERHILFGKGWWVSFKGSNMQIPFCRVKLSPSAGVANF